MFHIDPVLTGLNGCRSGISSFLHLVLQNSEDPVSRDLCAFRAEILIEMYGGKRLRPLRGRVIPRLSVRSSEAEILPDARRRRKMMKEMLVIRGKKLLAAGIGLLTVLLLFMNLWSLIRRSPDGMLRSGLFGVTALVVLSDSMYPTIRTGDLVLVQENGQELKAGDIIAFYDPSAPESGTIITHRIVETAEAETGEAFYITQGDSNNSPDRDAVARSGVIGVLRCRIGGLGYLLGFLKEHLLLILAGGLAFLIMAGLQRGTER